MASNTTWYYYENDIKNVGVFFRNKESFKMKWESPKNLNIDQKIKLPPIMMPSSGREACALLDLTESMEGSTYVQILIVRMDEKTSGSKWGRENSRM